VTVLVPLRTPCGPDPTDPARRALLRILG